MKLKADWSIKDYGYKPYEEAEVLPVEQILELAKKLKAHNDIIYLFHPTEPSDRMAIKPSEIGGIKVEVHGHGGKFVLHTDLKKLEELLNNFMPVNDRPPDYGFEYV